MSEDTRFRLLLDWVERFEALDDDEQDKLLRGLAAMAALDAPRSAGPLWRALYDLADAILDGGKPPPVDAVKRVRDALAAVGWSELGPDVERFAAMHRYSSLPGKACWRAIAQVAMEERHDREALERSARPSDPEDGWGGPTAATPGETPDVEQVEHWDDDDDTPEAASGG
jgi:hypothetical protein